MKLSQNVQAKQKGAALIAVLVILTIITLLGVTAMRMGLTSLSLATNSQVSHLLFQSADFGTTSLLNTILIDPVVALTPGGVAGDSSGAEMVYCVTPVDTATFAKVLTAGQCDVEEGDNFVSQRQIVATEVTVARVDISGEGSASLGNSSITQGSDNTATGNPQKLKIYSTAVAPSFGSASLAVINDCLANNVLSDDDEESSKDVVTKTDCLTNAGAVFTTHTSEYLISQ